MRIFEPELGVPVTGDMGGGTLEDKQPIISVLRTGGECEKLREVWKSWCTDPRADIDNVMAVVAHRPEVISPYVVVVHRGGKPDCLLVGYLEQRLVEHKLGYKVMRRSEVRALVFVRRGFLGNQSGENCNVVVAHVSGTLACREADCAVFSDLRADSPLRASLKSAGVLNRQHYFPTQRHRTLQWEGDFEKFFASLTRKDRHELRRHERMLHRDFPNGVRIRCIREETEVTVLVEAVDQIAQKTYQRALGTGFKKSAELEEQYKVAARAGALRGCILYLADQPCAFFVGRQYKSTFFAEYTGYDPAYAKYSPGMFMLLHSIREAFECANGIVGFDLGSGEHAYKRVVCHAGWEEGTAYLYAPTLRGVRLNAQTTAIEFINAGLRKLATRNELLKRARKRWQQRSSQNFLQEIQADR